MYFDVYGICTWYMDMVHVLGTWYMYMVHVHDTCTSCMYMVNVYGICIWHMHMVYVGYMYMVHVYGICMWYMHMVDVHDHVYAYRFHLASGQFGLRRFSIS